MKQSWFKEDDRILSEINVTPLVDVALVLLIVFMITAPMMIQGAEVRLPRTQIMDSLPQEQIFISVTDQGQILVNGDAVPLEELEARLSPRITPGRTILLVWRPGGRIRARGSGHRGSLEPGSRHRPGHRARPAPLGGSVQAERPPRAAC